MQQKTEVAIEGSDAMLARARRELPGEVRSIAETVSYWGARGWEVVTVIEITSADEGSDWLRGYNVIMKKTG